MDLSENTEKGKILVLLGIARPLVGPTHANVPFVLVEGIRIF